MSSSTNSSTYFDIDLTRSTIPTASHLPTSAQNTTTKADSVAKSWTREYANGAYLAISEQYKIGKKLVEQKEGAECDRIAWLWLARAATQGSTASLRIMETLLEGNRIPPQKYRTKFDNLKSTLENSSAGTDKLAGKIDDLYGRLQTEIVQLQSRIEQNQKGNENQIQKLEEQLAELRDQEDILWSEREIAIEQKNNKNKIFEDPSLREFHTRLQVKIEELFMSVKAASGGFVVREGGENAARAERIILLGEFIDIAPLVGSAVAFIIKNGIVPGLKKVDEIQQKNRAKNISDLGTFTQISQAAESAATHLTHVFSPQLKQLHPRGKELDASAGRGAKIVKKIQAKLLDAQHDSGPQKLAEFAAGLILDAIVSNKIFSHQDLDSQFIRLIEEYKSPENNKIKEIFHKLRGADLKTNRGIKWKYEEVFTKVGVMHNGTMYWNDECDTKTYGLCLGSLEMVKARGYDRSAPLLPTTPLSPSRPRPLMAANKQRITELKQQRNTLELQREQATKLANAAQIQAIQQQLEENQRKLARLERLIIERQAQSSRSHESQTRSEFQLTDAERNNGSESETSSDSEQ